MNPYQVLGVTPDTPLDEVNRVRRKLCAKYHPDSNIVTGGDREKFDEVNKAYDMITSRKKPKSLKVQERAQGVCFDTMFRMKLF